MTSQTITVRELAENLRSAHGVQLEVATLAVERAVAAAKAAPVASDSDMVAPVLAGLRVGDGILVRAGDNFFSIADA